MINFKWHDGSVGWVNDPVTIFVSNDSPAQSHVVDASGCKVDRIKEVLIRLDADDREKRVCLVMHDCWGTPVRLVKLWVRLEAIKELQRDEVIREIV